MEFEFDPAKDEANRFKHGLPLDLDVAIFAAEDHVILPSFRDEDAEERYKASERPALHRRPYLALRCCSNDFREAEQCE